MCESLGIPCSGSSWELQEDGVILGDQMCCYGSGDQSKRIEIVQKLEYPKRELIRPPSNTIS